MIELFALPLRYFSAYIAAMAGTNALRFTLWAVLFGAMLAALLWLALRHARRPGWGRLAAVCAFLAIAMNVSYQAMAGAVPAVRAVRFDAELLALDRWLLGETPSAWLARFAIPWLTELLSVCYFFFMPLLLVSLLRYFFRRRELLGEFYAGLFSVYGLGFLGYLLVPAAGPWLAYPELFDAALAGGPVTALNQTMVVQGSNRVDVWPSLHCAVSTFILGFAWRHHRREFLWLLLPLAGLWFSTLYLRYHYFIDVVSGFALAAFALYESHRYALAHHTKENQDAATA
ncbi:MAG: phosphatase PAP2 family protein [Sulfuricella sp.]|nr:phosphatase PAP2 family protein [Sulfuricella sp.]